MVRAFFTVVALLVASTMTCLADNAIQAEVPTSVNFSNTDINRIVCPGPMTDLIFSQEKGMTGHFSGNNGFIKFKIRDSGGKYVYADTQTELFVVCNSAVYTLLVTPTDMPSVTVRLAPPTGDSFKKNIEHYQKMPLEKQALQLIREAYNDSYPTSYRIDNSVRTIPLAPNLAVNQVQAVEVDGVGLRLKKYLVRSHDKGLKKVDEHVFLSTSISQSMFAVALESHTLQPNVPTRLFVVEQKEREK